MLKLQLPKIILFEHCTVFIVQHLPLQAILMPILFLLY
jgi:hypothetical protein